MKYVLLVLFITSYACTYEEYPQSWADQWKQIKKAVASGELQDTFATCLGIEPNICSFQERSVLEKENKNFSATFDSQSLVSVSVPDGKVSLPSTFGWLLIVVELFKIFKVKQLQASISLNMSYDNFLAEYVHLVPAEYCLLRIQKMLYLSRFGTFPEQILSRIQLVRSSMFYPYQKVMNSCAKKLLKKSFDEQGRFVWTDVNYADDAYKKFYTKVPQDWRGLVSNAHKISKKITVKYESHYFDKTNNEYNQTLITMIYEGIAKNFPRLKQLCRKYFDSLTQRLYEYYVDREVAKKQKGAFADPMIKQKIDGQSVEQKKQIHEEIVLREFYQKEMCHWLLQHKPETESSSNGMYDSVAQGNVVTDLPLDPNYRFVLLRKFVYKICHGSDTPADIFIEFFDKSGILKKYCKDAYIQKHFTAIVLNDGLFHKAVNFALAIKAKELDEITQKVSQLILHYVVLAYQAEDTKQYDDYKKQVKILFEALSYNSYDTIAFEDMQKKSN